METSVLVLLVLAIAFAGVQGDEQSRIVGGVPATVINFPWAVSLQFELPGGEYFLRCGASLLSASHLLTTVTCAPTITELPLLKARAGSDSYRSGGQLRDIVAFISHPSFNPSSYDYNAAVAIVATPFALSNQVAPVALPLPGVDPAAGTELHVIGWGAIDQTTQETSSTLRQVVLPLWSNLLCTIRVYGTLTLRQMCIGGLDEGGAGACMGDGGGSATLNGVQYGITSSAASCADPGIPGIYTRVSAVREWIQSMTGL